MITKNNFRGEFSVVAGNKTHNALFTMNALRLVLQGEKIKLESFDKWTSEDPLTSLPTIAYYSCINWHVQNGKPFKMNKEMFIALVLDSGELENIAEAIALAMDDEKK
jgi:hypothetical protein